MMLLVHVEYLAENLGVGIDRSVIVDHLHLVMLQTFLRLTAHTVTVTQVDSPCVFRRILEDLADVSTVGA